MEGQRLPDITKETCNYVLASLVIFGYEFFGTMMLILAVNFSVGNVASVALTLFFILLVTGPISGGHVNPAVSTGVLFLKGSGAFTQFVVMLAGQFTGAVVAAEVALLLIEHGGFEASKIPELTHGTEDYWQAMLIEAIATCVFVTSVLIVKHPLLNKHAVSGSNVLGCAVVAVTLFAGITIAGPRTGGSLNPAVSVAQHLMKQ